MTRTARLSPVSVLYAVGAVLGVPLGCLGLLVFLGTVTLGPIDPGMSLAHGEITGKRTELAPARLNRQLQASEIYNVLAYRFDDADGADHSGEARVGLSQFNRYVQGSYAAIYYDPKRPQIVSIGQPMPQKPNMAGGIALMVAGWGATLLLGNRAMAARRGYGWF